MHTVPIVVRIFVNVLCLNKVRCRETERDGWREKEEGEKERDT